VTITGGSLRLPVLGTQRGTTGAGADGTTKFTPAKDAPRPIQAGRGAPPASGAKVSLPSNKGCGSLRKFRITLPKARKGDRIVSALVLLNGKKQKVRRGKATIDLRKLPKGTYRVSVTVRFKHARTSRAARTYHTCTPGHKKR
jgi:hypothetical protein